MSDIYNEKVEPGENAGSANPFDATATNTDKKNVLGRLDGVNVVEARGWVFRPEHLEERVSVEILDDDIIIARGIADMVRPDLEKAGISDGRCGFIIPLPHSLADGDEHLITARTVEDRIQLPGEYSIKARFDKGVSGLKDTTITGWAIDLESPRRPLEIAVYESDELIAHGFADRAGAHGNYSFSIPLPVACLDGCSHKFVVREKGTGYIIGDMSIVTPVFISTGPLLDCTIEGVIAGNIFGVIRIADDCKPADFDLIVETESGVSGTVSFGKEMQETRNADGKTVPFVVDLGSSVASLPESFVFRNRITRQVAGKHSIPLRSDSGWGRFDRIEGVHCSGWALTEKGQTARVAVLVDGVPSESSPAIIEYSGFSNWDLPSSNFGFRVQLPDAALDGHEHEIGVRIINCTEALIGSKFRFKYEPKFSIDFAGTSALKGWILNLDSADYPLHLDVLAAGNLVGSGRSESIRDDVYKIHGYRNVGFNIPLDVQEIPSHNSLELEVVIAGTRIPAMPVTISVVTADELISAVEELEASFNTSDNAPLESGRIPQWSPIHGVDEVLRRDLLPKMIYDTRIAMRGGKTCYWSLNLCVAKQAKDNPIDVIVPICKGDDETLDCIKSILSAKCKEEYELIVVSDASTEPRLTKALRPLEHTAKFKLIENKQNLGVVSSVNCGMKLHESGMRDVVLLTPDTVVPSGWLDGLRAAAYSSPNIGTVTPFSDKATICSLPKPQFDNELPEGLDCQAMQDICSRVNEGVVIDMPTATGLCIYIRRKTLSEVGLFDEARWQQCIGAIGDFSMRASAVGWRNVAAPSVFIQNSVSCSFHKEKNGSVSEYLTVLNQLYPDYQASIQSFIRKDLLGPARSSVNIELLKRRASGFLLHIGHAWGGGTDRTIHDIASCLSEDGVQSLIMRPVARDRIELYDMEEKIPVSISLANGLSSLVDVLKQLGVFHIHIHQMIGYPLVLWELPHSLGVPYDVSVHDFFFICPRVQLINDFGIFCDQPDVDVCESCCASKPLQPAVEYTYDEFGKSVANWRTFHHEQLRAARRVITPSNDTLKRIQRYQTLNNARTLPHPESGVIGELRSRQGKELAVAVIGALEHHKGSNLLLRCASYVKANRVPIRFFVIGYTDIDKKFRSLGDVVITGRYRPADLPRFIDAYGCTIALYLSIWPETYSYTLSEAVECGLMPVALDLGAFRERLDSIGIGISIPFSQDPSAIVNALVEAGSKAVMASGKGSPIGRHYRNCLSEYYEL